MWTFRELPEADASAMQNVLKSVERKQQALLTNLEDVLKMPSETYATLKRRVCDRCFLWLEVAGADCRFGCLWFQALQVFADLTVVFSPKRFRDARLKPFALHAGPELKKLVSSELLGIMNGTVKSVRCALSLRCVADDCQEDSDEYDALRREAVVCACKLVKCAPEDHRELCYQLVSGYHLYDGECDLRIKDLLVGLRNDDPAYFLDSLLGTLKKVSGPYCKSLSIPNIFSCRRFWSWARAARTIWLARWRYCWALTLPGAPFHCSLSSKPELISPHVPMNSWGSLIVPCLFLYLVPLDKTRRTCTYCALLPILFLLFFTVLACLQ